MKSSRREFIKSAGALTVCFTLPAVAHGTRPATGGAAMIGGRLKIESNGVVYLMLGKVELGQGIGTALAQLAAEELYVDFERMRLTPVSTGSSPDESYTVSSISVQQSGPPTRKAAASARQYFVEQAARILGVPAEGLNVRDGAVFSGSDATGLDYWQLLGDQNIEMELSADVPLKPVSEYSLVGSSSRRIDIPGKVFGAESFLQDVRMPDMVHARVVRPPSERAELGRSNFGRTERMPGVLGVIQDGNFVAVIAEREEQARAAARQLRRDLKWRLPDDMPDATRLYEWLKDAPSRRESIVDDRMDLGADAATRTIRASYQRPFQAHASISPSAAVALYRHGQLTVASHAQGMYPLRTAIAHVLDLDVENVRCIHYEASGCFGHNGADDAACDAAALAMRFPGRPVRLQWERADEFAWEPYGSAMHIEASAAIDRSGTIRGWNYDLWSCPHTSRPRSEADAGHLIYARHREKPLEMPAIRSIPQPNGGADRNGIPIYNFSKINVAKHLLTDVPIRVSALRGLGAYANVFAIESFMDELANVVGEDPLAYRIRHLDDDRAIAVLEMLADASGWRERAERGSGDGWGLGFAQFKNRSSYVGIVMRLAVHAQSGSIRLKKATAVCDAGLVINPDGASAQIEGGIVQSASWTLKEQVRFSTSEKQSVDWASYPILRFTEVPEIEVHFVDRDDRPSLGVGEAAQGPTAAAIANAVFHATGQRLRRLPLAADQATAARAS